VVTGRALPVAEAFTAPAFPPAGWQVQDPDNDAFTWELSAAPVTGPAGTAQRLPTMNWYDYPNRGRRDYLVLPPVRVPASRVAQLQFAVAYSPIATYNDALSVDISFDCGQTFQPTSYSKVGAQLATTASVNSRFVPTSAAQWRRETVDLSPYLATAPANADMVVRLNSRNDYGQDLFLADVLVQDLVTATHRPAGLAQFAAYPVPVGGQLTVVVQAASASAATLLLTDAVGRELRRQAVRLTGQPQQLEVPTEALAAGVYTLRLLLPDGRSQALQVVK
jgi:hypothetical protein